MKRTNYYFPPQTLIRLQAAKTILGIPMSEIVRRALDTFLERLGV